MKKETRKIGMRTRRLIASFIAFITCFILNTRYVYAISNIGENVGNWFLDQLFWFALIVVFVLIVICASKKAWIAMVTVIIGGGVILFLIGSPLSIKDIGSQFWNIIVNGVN